MKEDTKVGSSVGVIGAGIQGICISLFLVKKGFKVTIIDRDEPGKKFSFLWKRWTFLALCFCSP